MAKQDVLRFSVITVHLPTALSRLIPHPANFAPIGRMALFGAAYYVPPCMGMRDSRLHVG